VNYANVPDITFVYVKVSRTATASSFTPVARGCSRKIDFTFDPLRRISRLRLKTTGTIGGRFGRDLDRFRFRN
jgi:hypothetical protein